MKVGEARSVYSTQIKAYQEQKMILTQRKQELEQKMQHSQEAKDAFSEEAATLELTIDALDKKQSEYQKYMEGLMSQWTAQVNVLVAEQQGDAMEEYAENEMKVMEVARRLMKGAIVPATDERKLMDYSMELYQTAKNIGAMVQRRKKEEYDSLWGDEEKKEYEDPYEVADNKEAFSSGPAIVDVADTMAAVEAPEG